MHIGIAGPIATENIAWLLHTSKDVLPPGYYGAPLLSTIIAELLVRGHRVSAFTTTSDVSLGKREWVTARGDNFELYYCGARRRSFRPTQGKVGRAADFFSLERSCLCNALKIASPNIIHAHWVYEFGLAAIATGIPHVVTCHDAPQKILQYMPNLYRFVRYLMGRKCLASANSITAVSPYLKSEVERYTSVPIVVIPNPVHHKLISTPVSFARKRNVLISPKIAMVCNGWGKRKNSFRGLEAFALVKNRYPEAELHLFGSDFGPGETAERWARKKNIATGMHFYGHIPHAKLISRLAEMHLLLHPSLEESFGMSVVEAMAVGLPVVGGQSSGGVPWAVDDGGVLIDVTSSLSIRNAICKLLDDPLLYEQTVKRALTRAQSGCFSPKKVVDLYESQYKLALRRTL